jgi:cytoplasmic iron level regulating protein YaaA (DUF328/UPF0246 family)
MQIILSPAKLMDFGPSTKKIAPTQPLFPKKTSELIAVYRKLSVEEIAEKMKINIQKAYNVYEYFQTFDFNEILQRPAILVYNGMVYKGLNANDFTEEDFAFAQNHLIILSGLYGILRPLDGIKPYRFELRRQIVPKGYKNLYDFWNRTINEYIAKRLEENNKTIVNLASGEFIKMIKPQQLPKGTTFIEINFLEQRGNDLRQITVHTKKARGLMARFIIKNKLSQIEDIKAFDYEDYFYYPALSTQERWTFVR